MRRHPYEESFDRELRSWPGLRAEYRHGGKHLVMEVWSGDRRVLVYHYPGTPSDIRGVPNALAGLRRLLRHEGLERVYPAKAVVEVRKRRERSPVVLEREPSTGGPNRDPWAPLRAMMEKDG